MQRRSSGRATRKRYTVDALEALPELRDNVDPDAAAEEVHADVDEAFAAVEEEASEEDISEGDTTPVDDEGAEIDEVEVEDQPFEKPLKVKKDAASEIGEHFTTRGIPDGSKFHLEQSKANKRKVFFGGAAEDCNTFERAIDKWSHLPVLPDRKSGFHLPFLNDEDIYQTQVDADWQCTQSLHARQSSVTLEYDTVKESIGCPARHYLLGPFSDPRRFVIQHGMSIPIQSGFTSTRSGYILNAGGRISCLEWLPYCTDSTQYLAMSTSAEQQESLETPAYIPKETSRTYIQIWRIDVEKNGSDPSIKMLLGTDYGHVKQFRFCSYRASSSVSTLRLLGSIWSDGNLRVLVIPSPQDHTAVEVHHITRPALESQPPDTVYTCLTWMSPRRIAAGCANGCVAIFDIRDGSDNWKPRKFAAASPTYILDIASCSPTLPNMLCMTSMDGHMRMTDTSQSNMAEPHATIPTSRVRTILTNCAWHDYTRAALLTDDTFGVRLHLARRFFNLFTIGRTRSTPTALAVSQCHPFVLTGTAAGEVQAVNPLIKLIDTKIPAWQQTWFRHEWRRGRTTDTADVVATGLSRFTEGYKIERMQLTTMSSEAQVGRFMTNTVYEKGTAITSLSWNPNLCAGGWAAAGMADGLVRIEDLTLQTSDSIHKKPKGRSRKAQSTNATPDQKKGKGRPRKEQNQDPTPDDVPSKTRGRPRKVQVVD